ncbi:MAG: transglycosylase SLT domain-containing protein, partial [Candidatus Dormibacteraceae bacterium]
TTPRLAAASGAPSPARRVVARLISDEAAMRAARTESQQLQAQPAPPDLLGQVRLTFASFNSGYAFREAARDEQDQIDAAAADPALAADVERRAPAPISSAVARSVRAIQAIRRLAGITDPSQIHYHLRAFDESTPPQQLLAYYRAAAARSGIDWTYLAAINYVESDFGRDVGPSGAGALGPMQFEPATWQEYGHGGDILDPRTAIFAAARYLANNGAPGDMHGAVFAYNHDQDYVIAVSSYAAAMRADAGWLDRYYCWSTFG